jgi:hypothetical protein
MQQLYPAWPLNKDARISWQLAEVWREGATHNIYNLRIENQLLLEFIEGRSSPCPLVPATGEAQQETRRTANSGSWLSLRTTLMRQLKYPLVFPEGSCAEVKMTDSNFIGICQSFEEYSCLQLR